MSNTKETTDVDEAVRALIALDRAHGSVINKAVIKFSRQSTPGAVESMIHTANGIARDLKRTLRPPITYLRRR